MKKKQAGLAKERELNIGIDKKDLKISVDILNTLLADEFVLLVQTLNYHWNLVGPEFNDYHKLLDDQYRILFGLTDDLAERVRTVGGIAFGTMTEFIHNATLKEDTHDIPAPRDMIKQLLSQHEKIIRAFRDGVIRTAQNNRDLGTSNFLTDIMEKHEKLAWMLRSLTERR